MVPNTRNTHTYTYTHIHTHTHTYTRKHTHTHLIFDPHSSAPTISWFKDGVDLSSSSRVTFAQTNKILAISNISVGDGGAYSCKATQFNGYFITSAPAQLTVLGKKQDEVGFGGGGTWRRGAGGGNI